MNLRFHLNALQVSFAEQFSQMGEGVRKFFGEEHERFSDDVYVQARGKLEPMVGSLGAAASEGIVRLFANVTYFVGRPLTDGGEAIGTGLGMICAGRSGEERALGVAAVLGGLGGGAGLAAGGLGAATAAPLSIPIPTLVQNGGALAFATAAVSVPLPAAAATAAGYATSIHAMAATRSRGETKRPSRQKLDPVQRKYDRHLRAYRRMKTPELAERARFWMKEMRAWRRNLKSWRQWEPPLEEWIKSGKVPRDASFPEVDALETVLRERRSRLLGKFVKVARRNKRYIAAYKSWWDSLSKNARGRVSLVPFYSGPIDRSMSLLYW